MLRSLFFLIYFFFSVCLGARLSLCICQLADTFWICDSPICSLQYSLKLAIHAVWQTKTGWLSSNSLQTDSPASGCHAKTERSGTEIETVSRGIPVLPLCFLQFSLRRQCCLFSAAQSSCGFTTTGTRTDKTKVSWSATRNHHSSSPSLTRAVF